jgi:hypothetical protein
MPKKPKPPKLMKFDKKIRLKFARGKRVSVLINGKETKLQEALQEFVTWPGVKKTEQGYTLSAPSAEKLIERLEKLGKHILTKHGFPDDWRGCGGIDDDPMPEEAYHAREMLFCLWQTRHWMRQHTTRAAAIEALTNKTTIATMCGDHLKNMSETMNAAVREAINAMWEFVYIHESGIGDHYICGQDYKNRMRIFADRSAELSKKSVEPKHQRICNAARKSLDQGNKRSDIVKNLAEIHGYTKQSIRRILRKSGL